MEKDYPACLDCLHYADNKDKDINDGAPHHLCRNVPDDRTFDFLTGIWTIEPQVTPCRVANGAGQCKGFHPKPTEAKP